MENPEAIKKTMRTNNMYILIQAVNDCNTSTM